MTAGAHTSAGSSHRVRGYTLRRFLAQGGMAELFLAQPTASDRAAQIVVVKRVLPQFVQDQQFARMFAREASLASMLKHPNIVEVFDDEAASEEECFFAMEYVHGPDLNMLLKELKDGTRPVPLEHALQIAMGMCQGLHYAHEYRGDDGQLLSIVHRDVSPSNVMVSDHGEVKITDFGVAKALALTSFTQAGTRKGKLSYMSPEQAVADPVDRRTDIFAIGTVLFEMTTLQRMFGGENELAIMHKLLFRERPRPSAIRHDYPPELERIVMRAVAQKPENRFDTANEMYEALRDFAERRRLQSTPAALARWVGTIIPPSQHPAADPSFYQGHASATMLAVPPRRDTVVAGDVQPTVSDSGITLDATALGTSGPSPVVGQLHAAPATRVGMAGTMGTGQSSPPSLPTAAVPAPSFAAGSSAASRRPTGSGSSTLPAIAIVSGAVAVGAVILAGALWYADARKDRSTSSMPPTAPAVTADPEPSSSEPVGLPPGLVDDVADTPIVLEDDPPDAEQPQSEPKAPPPESVRPEPEAPQPKPDSRPAAKKRRVPQQKTKRRRKPEPEAAETPRPTPPKPTDELDDLFPGQ